MTRRRAFGDAERIVCWPCYRGNHLCEKDGCRCGCAIEPWPFPCVPDDEAGPSTDPAGDVATVAP